MENSRWMKWIRKGLFICMIFSFVLPNQALFIMKASERVKITNITKGRKILKVGTYFQIKSNYKNQKLLFRSSKKSVAAVSKKGLVMAKRKGKTVITVRVKGAKRNLVSCQLIVNKIKNYSVTAKNKKNAGESNSISYVINKAGNKAFYDEKLTKQLTEEAMSFSSGSMNNIDPRSQQYCLSKEHLLFLNEVSEKWALGVYSTKEARRMGEGTLFKLHNTDKKAIWNLNDSSFVKYEVKSRNTHDIFNEICRTNNSAFMYVYMKSFYDSKTGITSIYFVNGKIW